MDTQQVLVTIMQGEQLVMTSLPMAIDLALKLKALFGTTELTFNMQAVTNEAVTADEATIQAVEAWKTSVGIK